MISDWQDVLIDEDPVNNPTVDLPDENEKEGEDNGQGSEASGALSEDDDPKGMDDEPAGDHEDFTGTKPSDFDDMLSVYNEASKDDDDDKSDDDSDDDKDKDDDKSDDDDKSEDKDDDLKDIMSFVDEDPVGNPSVDLPDENEKEGEDNGQDSEAAGALSEDDDPDGMKTEPFGEDEITGTKSNEYDDVLHFIDEAEKDDDDDDKKSDDDDDDKGSDDDDKGSDDDDASKSEPLKGDDDEKVKDFASFFDDADIVEPDGLPSGSSAEPAEPVDGNGDDVSPIGDPDLPENLTEPVILPVASPNGSDGELKNIMNIFDEDPTRFFYGNF